MLQIYEKLIADAKMWDIYVKNLESGCNLSNNKRCELIS